ncbi:MAG TPA: hydrogenase expression/formation protein HypE [Armatimonadota bacterium]|jgi:hydrogenase expression/formation protein HypE|nr:hydrogenase expression/formation protein HypE [Armatimonadota bacterium]
MDEPLDFNLTCPAPIRRYPHILLAHGGGGRLMHDLLDSVITPAFKNEILNQGHDSAVLDVPTGRLAFTTDSYVVHPLFFPGGDIGSMAVYGTVNDLAMSGASAVALSVGLILEEGLPMETLWRVVQSIGAAARQCGVRIATGDTKVVERGKGDGVFVNTSGVGVVRSSNVISPAGVLSGDVIIVNGDLGRHGMAVMAVREGLEFESEIDSDSAPVAEAVMALIDAGIDVHCLRDLTRGGLASTVNEIAKASGTGITLEETAVPVRSDVSAACEILGFDPLYVACEGRFAAFVPERDAERAVEIISANSPAEAAVIGRVTGEPPGLVTLTSRIGTRRILDMMSGEQLPRIC